jgi:hypothetical protein
MASSGYLHRHLYASPKSMTGPICHGTTQRPQILSSKREICNNLLCLPILLSVKGNGVFVQNFVKWLPDYTTSQLSRQRSSLQMRIFVCYTNECARITDWFVFEIKLEVVHPRCKGKLHQDSRSSTTLTDSQPPEQETIRGNPWRSSDTSQRAQKSVLLYSVVWKILYITILTFKRRSADCFI